MSTPATIRLPVRFDYNYHKQFSKEYSALLEDPAVDSVTLDFSQVDYLDSSALGMMVLLQKKLEQHKKQAKLKGARGSTLGILQMANMQNIYEFI